MDNNLQEKIELIKKINTDDSNFIIKVYEAFKDNQSQIETKKQLSNIILDTKNISASQNIINLDNIWVKPYFYTKMRLKLDDIIQQVINIDKTEIISNPSNACNKIIFHKINKTFEKPNDKIDIVQFIKSIDKSKKCNFIFYAKELNEETLFKEEQLKKAIDIINIDDLEKRYNTIYNEIYTFLERDFISNKYCDFRDNKCVAQRNHTAYPINRRDGCCFTRIKTCPHLEKGNCTIECLACRLFSCPYLTKRGIGYWATEFILLQAFLNKKQRKHLVFDFYQPKPKIIRKIIKLGMKCN